MVRENEDEASGLADFTDFEPKEREEISALLSSKQRAYLRGYSDIEPKSAQERTVRSRIRNRLIQSLEDMDLLQSRMERRDVEKAFSAADLFNSLSGAVGLIFDGMSRASKHDHLSKTGENPDEETIEMLEELVKDGITDAYESHGIEIEDVEASIDVEVGRTSDEIVQKDLTDIPFEDLTFLVRSGEISREEFVSAIEQRSDTVQATPDSDTHSVTVIHTEEGEYNSDPE